MISKKTGKQKREWIRFCKETYDADADDVSDAYKLANDNKMREKLSEKRIRFLESILIPKYVSN